jgi:hypothetical protein
LVQHQWDLLASATRRLGRTDPDRIARKARRIDGVDPTSVYWTNPAAGTVIGCPIAGCGATPVTVAVGQANPTGIAADAQGVYWANVGSNGAYDGSLYRWRAGDASPVCLVSGIWGPELVVLDASFVYWSSGNHTIQKAPR